MASLLSNRQIKLKVLKKSGKLECQSEWKADSNVSVTRRA